MARSPLLPLLPLLLLGARAAIPPASGPPRPDLGAARRRHAPSRRRAQDGVSLDSLVSEALSLNEFNAIRASEAPQDFGGVDSATADGLWDSAIEFEYEVRTGDLRSAAVRGGETSTSHCHGCLESQPSPRQIEPPSLYCKVSNAEAELYPHTICSSEPDMSGDERGAHMTFVLESVRTVSPADWRTSDYLFHNTGSVSCGILMASAGTVSAVYGWRDGEGMEHVSVNPLLGSMKMVAQTVNILQARMAGTDLGAVSISSGGGGGGGDSPAATAPESRLGLRLVLCPGAGGSGDEVVAAVKGRALDVGGVLARSFYASQEGSGDVPTTDRMDFWTSSVDAVAGTSDDGSNYCVDTLLDEQMSYRVSMDDAVMEVFSRLTPADIERGIAAGNFTLDQYQDCMWYAVYALSLDPYVCSVEPEARVGVVCDDGSLDLLGLGCGGGQMSHLTAKESNVVDDSHYYALSLNEWNAVRSTESPQDFGGLSGEETDGLWSDAARFEYQVRLVSFCRAGPSRGAIAGNSSAGRSLIPSRVTCSSPSPDRHELLGRQVVVLACIPPLRSVLPPRGPLGRRARAGDLIPL